jgi:hypothetical protein
MAKRVLLALVFVVSGCTSTYTKTTVSEPTVVLQRGKNVAIAVPENGFYETKQYAESGHSTALAVQAAFAKFAGRTSIVSECKTLPCLEEKMGTESDYLVVPEILHWEDRATEWSGKKDKLEIKLSVYDAKTGKELASAVLAGKSKWGTFGGDHPQDLLPEPIDGYVATLF